MVTLDFASVLIIALGLSADCFAVAFGATCGQRKTSWAGLIRMSVVFGIFQAVMPTLGWLLGHSFADIIEPYDHWIAFGLLALIGGRMLWESFHKKQTKNTVDITRGWPLLVLAVATSIDALAAGLSFAFLAANIVTAVITIGVTAFIVTAAGYLVGRKAGGLLGKWTELAGGIVLIGIGTRILIAGL